MGIKSTFINSPATVWQDRDLNHLQQDLQLEGVVDNTSLLVTPVSGQRRVSVAPGAIYMNATVASGLTSLRSELDTDQIIDVPAGAGTFYIYMTISSTVPNAAGEGAATLNIGTSVPANSYQLAHFTITAIATEVTGIIDDRELFDREFRQTGDGNVLPYSAVTNYTPDNIVEYDNKLFKNIIACTNIVPTNETYWVLVAGSDDISVWATTDDSQLVAGGWADVDFQTEIEDDHDFHDTSTDPHLFTVPTGKAGKYLLIATVRVWMDNVSNGEGFYIRYARNLTNETRLYTEDSMFVNGTGLNGVPKLVTVSDIVELQEGMTIHLRVYCGAGSYRISGSRTHFKLKKL